MKDIDLDKIRNSEFFDEEWYLQNHPEVVVLGYDPIVHYLKFGNRLKYLPSPKFNPSHYYELNYDVRDAGIDALVHFVEYGHAEGRPYQLEQGHHHALDSSKFLRPRPDPFEAWLKVNEGSEASDKRLRDLVTQPEFDGPLISIIMPVYRPPMDYFQDAVESVLSQIYPHWELCMHLDGAHAPEISNWLDGLEASDPRVKVSKSAINQGISLATNAAVKLASGEFIAFFDQDDLLTKAALGKIALAAKRHPRADILYSDDDKIGGDQTRYAPQFKPGWAPTLLLSYMYMSHLFVVRRSLFEKLGGFRAGFEGSQDYDFALRAAEEAREVHHIPDILYHWRAIAGSTAVSGDAKPASFEAGRRAVEEACRRRGILAEATHPDWAQQAKCGIFSLTFPNSGPKVTIIIPTKNKVELLQACVSSIESMTTYKNYEILILDNDSDDPATLKYLNSCGHSVLRIASKNGKFNFSNLINQGVDASNSDYVLLLNNDTVVKSRNWLSQMIGFAQMPGVGAVGAKLYFDDDTIQHAGIVHGLYGGLAGPAFRGFPNYHHGYLEYLKVPREYAAVTAACLLTKKDIFNSLGGLNEENFAVAYNDVDFCYRLVNSGLSCIYCPDAELYHFEGKSRGYNDNLLELAAFRSRYKDFVDKWYNPNLTLENESFEIRPWVHVDPATTKVPIKALMFTHNLNHEGAPNSMFELVDGLRSMDCIDPLVVSPSDGPLRTAYNERAVPISLVTHPLADCHTESEFNTRLDLLANMIRSSKAEVVYSNTAEGFWSIEAASRAGVPSIWNIRESEPWHAYYNALPEFARSVAYNAFYKAYRIVFVANSTRDGWGPMLSQNNSIVIQNGLNLTRVEARSKGATRETARQRLNLEVNETAIVLLGTVCERKNQAILVEALGLIPTKFAKSVRVFIVGDRPGGYSDRLHDLVQSLPREWRESVVIEPETDEPYLYLKAADISVCSSIIESYPRVVLEAMALGLPLVTTSVFGIAEQAQHNVNALFFEPDRADQLSAALISLIDDIDKRTRFAKNSLTLFNGLTQYNAMLEKYAAVVKEATFSSSQGLVGDEICAE